MPSTSRADLRDAICADCGAKCIPGQTHEQHNAGWLKKVLMWDFLDLQRDKWPGWDMVERGGGYDPQPPTVVLTIRNKIDRASEDIGREWDDIATSKFYWSEWQADGGVFVSEGDAYYARFYFEKKEDAYAFAIKYGGQPGG